MFDFVIRGGRVVESDGVAEIDLAIVGERIGARLRRDEPADALHTLDARGKLLLPGLVDAHVHFREPGLTWKEDFASGTQAAITGGVTTALVMPTDDPWTATAETFAAKAALARGRLFCDVALQVAVARDTTALPGLAALGPASFEIFTADVPDAFLYDTCASLEAAIAAVASVGGIVAISPGEQSILTAAIARLAPGRSTPAEFVGTRPGYAEAQGIARAVLAAAATRTAAHIRQSNSKEGMATFRRLRDMADVTLETSPQCLMFTARDYARLGPEAKASPPWRSEADRDAVRAAVADRTIDIIVTDHAPHGAAEKQASVEDFANVPGGFPGVQTLFVTLLALVDEGLIGWPDLVRLAATRPAEIFGLGGRKGRLTPGHDADILVVDPARPFTVRRVDQRSKSTFTPFEDLTVSATLERVFLRGRLVVASDGIVDAATGLVLHPRAGRAT